MARYIVVCILRCGLKFRSRASPSHCPREQPLLSSLQETVSAINHSSVSYNRLTPTCAYIRYYLILCPILPVGFITVAAELAKSNGSKQTKQPWMLRSTSLCAGLWTILSGSFSLQVLPLAVAQLHSLSLVHHFQIGLKFVQLSIPMVLPQFISGHMIIHCCANEYELDQSCYARAACNNLYRETLNVSAGS